MARLRGLAFGLLFVFLAHAAVAQPLFFEDFKNGYAANWKPGFPWELTNVIAPTYVQVNATTPSLNPFSLTADGLRIIANRTSDPAAKGKPYYTGLLTSKAPASVRIYGYYEFVAKMPSGAGAVNGALWLYPTGASNNAEIDVIEHIADYVMQTVWDGSAHNPTQGTTVATVTDWHTYAVEWNAVTITFWTDGKQTFQTPTPANSKNVPMQIVLSVNIKDPASDGTTLPNYMTVRSVGVWASKAARDTPVPPVSGLTAAQKAAVAAVTADMAKVQADYTAMLRALGL